MPVSVHSLHNGEQRGKYTERADEVVMVNYKELGLVNTREMFRAAVSGGYAIPAYNFNNMEQLQAIVIACAETRSPVIIQVSKGAREYANETLLRYLAMGAVKMSEDLGVRLPMALHLDHGDSFELCVSCIENGFSSVMIDGSHLPYEKNVELTARVVEYAHRYDVTVEGELGVLAGIEDEVSSEVTHYTKPEEVEDCREDRVDSLAISIGTSHGRTVRRARGSRAPLRHSRGGPAAHPGLRSFCTGVLGGAGIRRDNQHDGGK